MNVLHTLGVEESKRATNAVVEEAKRDGRPMAVVVADAHGDLISCLRMDGAAARVLRQAIRKAYTAAVMGRDTLTFKADLQERNGSLAEWGDPMLTTLQGGVVVRIDGEVVGSVGVGGNTLVRDTEVALIALRAITSSVEA